MPPTHPDNLPEPTDNFPEQTDNRQITFHRTDSTDITILKTILTLQCTAGRIGNADDAAFHSMKPFFAQLRQFCNYCNVFLFKLNLFTSEIGIFTSPSLSLCIFLYLSLWNVYLSIWNVYLYFHRSRETRFSCGISSPSTTSHFLQPQIYYSTIFIVLRKTTSSPNFTIWYCNMSSKISCLNIKSLKSSRTSKFSFCSLLLNILGSGFASCQCLLFCLKAVLLFCLIGP